MKYLSILILFLGCCSPTQKESKLGGEANPMKTTTIYTDIGPFCTLNGHTIYARVILRPGGCDD